MPPLYITEQNTRLRICNSRLTVRRESDSGEETLFDAPIGTISQVVLFGNIGLTTPAISTLLDKNIDTVFLDHHGNFKGRLQGSFDLHIARRRAQYQALGDEAFNLDLARAIVKAKIHHQKVLLRRQNQNKGDEYFRKCQLAITRAAAALDKKETLNELRGAEGACAAAYFSAYKLLFGPEWHFEARLHHPSPDPVNAMLSFGYTLLTRLADGAVQAVGLDPSAGILHSDLTNRPALTLDLVEEFRPVIDGLVLWCCHSGAITPDDFMSSESGCFMNNAARKTFVKAYEERIETRLTHPLTGTRLTLRQCLMEQARQLAAIFEAEEERPAFVPMEFK